MNKVILLLLATVFADANAFHNDSNCMEEFYTILEKAAEIKSHCNMRGFYDCCEVTQCIICILFQYAVFAAPIYMQSVIVNAFYHTGPSSWKTSTF